MITDPIAVDLLVTAFSLATGFLFAMITLAAKRRSK
jgi:hypothetical protein